MLHLNVIQPQAFSSTPRPTPLAPGVPLHPATSPPLKLFPAPPMSYLNGGALRAAGALADYFKGVTLMSISGISSSNFFQSLSSNSLESNFQSFKKDFQQLGQDLQSGNLSQAQADFAAMQPPAQPVSSSSQSSSTSSSLSSAFHQLATDLQSGNLTAAQSDYSAVQQDLQQQSSSVQGHHHHHHHPQSAQSSGAQNSLNSLFSQLGQALQSGNLSAAQSAYSSLQQEFEQLGTGASSSTSPSSTSSSSVNVTA